MLIKFYLEITIILNLHPIKQTGETASVKKKFTYCRKFDSIYAAIKMSFETVLNKSNFLFIETM